MPLLAERMREQKENNYWPLVDAVYNHLNEICRSQVGLQHKIELKQGLERTYKWCREITKQEFVS